MQTLSQSPANPKWMTIVGWLLTLPPVAMLILSGVMKFVKPEALIEGFGKFGWKVELASGLGVVELAATALYLIPRTSVLGAILLTGYLGGAVATHVRVDDPYIFPIILGVVLWGALWLRDPRIRTLLPVTD